MLSSRPDRPAEAISGPAEQPGSTTARRSTAITFVTASGAGSPRTAGAERQSAITLAGWQGCRKTQGFQGENNIPILYGAKVQAPLERLGLNKHRHKIFPTSTTTGQSIDRRPTAMVREHG